MARKDPYDPEEGIIDLFDIVDDPEASPEPEPRGALHDDGGQALPGQPEAADPETPPGEESERVVSRYPFENSDDFLEEIEKTPLMTLLPPKGEASALPEEPVSDGAEEEAPAESLGEPVREDPDEALIRAFEAEMAKAGAVVHGYGVETVPGMADASGVPDETEAPALSSDAVDQEFAEMHLEAQEPPVPEPAERPYAEDLELLFGDAPVADAPQVGPSPVAPEPAMEAPMLVSPEGEEGSKADPGLSQQAEAAPEGAVEEPSEALPSSVSADEVAEPLPEPSGDGTDRTLAFVPVAVPDVPVSAAVPQAEPSCGHEMEERIIRLEEALSRLNERVVALEQRADGAAEQDLNVSAISGDIQSLLTEGNALCGQLKSLAAELGSTPSGVSAEAPEAAPLPGSSAEVAEEPPFPPVPSRSAEIPWESSSPEADPDDGPDVLGLALESLERRLALLESRPVQAPDAAGIVQDVLALVRVDMEKASEEQEASARALEQLERRVQELESRPLPQLILPDLPDTEAITADVMSRIQNELDRIAAEAAARVLREEIAGLMGK
ncbi:hypothetical protein [Bilophila wadsworthia]|uniref:hypothetical protein n=1 Tax=Bilophila wadsworthia TaxID=35833 RepID=UPI00266CD239|nr:hypothetical protein [Bilophila wadsworthia]